MRIFRKNIHIIPLSEWIDYRFSNFSDVIRYTKSFKKRQYIQKNGFGYFKLLIENKFWFDALEYTKNAANLSITNETQFVEKYIIEECEKMINGLEYFLNSEEVEAYDESNSNFNENNKNKTRLNINGFEMIDFKTEKIVGALDFIDKINEYNKITPTQKFVSRIIEINRKFIPNIFITIDRETIELEKAKVEFDEFQIEHNVLVEKNKFYRDERLKLSYKEFNEKYFEEFNEFNENFNRSNKQFLYLKNKISLHTGNIEKMKNYLKKYNEYI